MSEEREKTSELSNSVVQKIHQIVKQNRSLCDKNAEELETVLATLAAFPFKDEIQQTSFLERIQRLQGYHIIQVFNLGVTPLQNCYAESSAEFIEEVIKLFEICFSFCYTTDVSKRISFDYCVRVLKFCFPLEPKQRLSTGVVSKLLELVQSLQKGELAEIVCRRTKQDANSTLQIHGTNYFFAELLQTFQSRRHEDCLVEIIEQTVRLASADAKIKCIQQHVIGEVALRSEHVVSPVFLSNWMKLLKLVTVTNGFAFSLAKVDSLSLSRTEQIMPFFFGGIVLQTNLTYQSTVCSFVRILEEMKKNGIEVILPRDKDRLDMFFKHLNQFCDRPNLAARLLKLLADTGINSGVLREVLDLFFYKDRMASDVNREVAFELVFNALSLLPDGELVKRALKFWKDAFSEDPGYQALVCLLTLLDVDRSNGERVALQERAERTLDFLEWLPHPIRLLISFWQGLLLSFIRIFPTTFQRRPEVLVLIQKALLAVRVPAQQRQADVACEQIRTLQFLEWLSTRSCTEETKTEMIWILMCSTDKAVSLNWVLDTGVIRVLGLCPRLPFGTKRQVVRELNKWASFFKDQEKRAFKKFVENVASNETLEFMDELFFEFLDFIARFVDKQRTRTIPKNVLELLSLLSRISISGERRVKVMQLSKKSSKDLLSGLRIMQLIERHHCVLKERTNEYFDRLFSAVVETLKGDNTLCEQFYNQHCCGLFPSTEVLNVWTSSVAELISLGLFKEEIDSRCCCRVLRQAWGFRSSCEISQLFGQVMLTADKIVQLSSQIRLKACSPSTVQHSSPKGSTKETDLLEDFVESAVTILGTDMLSSCEKMFLVKKLCDIVLSTPDIKTTTNLRNALTNLISYKHWQQSSTSSGHEDINLEFNCIVTVMENHTVLAGLSRIPESAMDNFLCDVLFTKMSSSFCKDNFVDIFLFIGSLKDLDQAFFDHLLPFLEVVIQESMSVENVLDLLKKLVQLLRNIHSEIIPITMSNFAYLAQTLVNKDDRDIFLTEVAMRWKLSPNHRIISYLEVPRLLWRAYNSASTPEKRYEMIDRVQEILNKVNKVEAWVMSIPLHFETPENYIRRRIACCELEWLVFYSSLSTEDAALAFDLSCLSFQRVFECNFKCFTFCDVQISEDGIFTFVSRENKMTSEVHVPENDTGMTSDVAVAPIGHSILATEPQKPILTPVLVAKEVIYLLKGVLGHDNELSESAFSLWDLVFSSMKPYNWCDAECESSYPVVDDFLNVLLSILAEASSTEMMFQWAKLNQHHVYQCSEVILKACKWEGEDNDKEALLKLQTVVSTTLEKMRLNTHTTPTTPWAISVGARCFRLLTPQLIHMRNLLDCRLPIEVTTRVLELYQINIQAGVTVGEVVSLWSCKQQSLKLVEDVQSFCEGDEISSLKPAQSKFAWQMLKAYGRFCMNSCTDLTTKFKELIVLYDPEDAYGLNRLPKWREMMIADGFPVGVIDSWCAAFLMTPLDDLTSRDVDAIVDLNSRSLQLVSFVSQNIVQLIFPKYGFQVTQGQGIKERQTKERIRLARLLGEFINILKVRKPEENRKDAVVRDIVVDACFELCERHQKKRRKGKQNSPKEEKKSPKEEKKREKKSPKEERKGEKKSPKEEKKEEKSPKEEKKEEKKSPEEEKKEEKKSPKEEKKEEKKSPEEEKKEEKKSPEEEKKEEEKSPKEEKKEEKKSPEEEKKEEKKSPKEEKKEEKKSPEEEKKEEKREEKRRKNDLYKIHGQKLKALFTEVFGKRHKSEDGQISIRDCGVTYQAGEQELRDAVPVTRQSSYLHENLPSVLSQRHVYEPMLVLLRRWLSGINTKPTLASYILEIVQLLFKPRPSDVGPDLLQQSQDIIQTHILSLEGNQFLMAQLQAAGYNQTSDDNCGLWSSRAVELPCYLSKRESPNSRLFTKKLTKVLRPLWNEWKDILFMRCIASIKVGEDEVCTKDLFGVQASLDEMEKQAAVVKEVVKQIKDRQINSEDLDRRVKHLMRLEQQHRARIEKLYKSNRVGDGSLFIFASGRHLPFSRV